jgi:serine/threonine protein kinase
MMVLEYANHGSLRDYLRKNHHKLIWAEKLEILINIIDNLEFIHDRGYIHKDLHSGNILQFYYNGLIDTKITDLGLAQYSIDNSNSSSSTSVCGVLPYMAPEIINGKPYTFASDIYSFGIIMVEVSTGKPPYENISHDVFLAIEICNGLRPKVTKGTPKCYINLVNRCLDANPEERPKSKEILKIIRNWRFSHDHTLSNSGGIKMLEEFINADKMKIPQGSSAKTMLHPGAVYTSRVMSFNSLCEPKNSVGIQIEDSEDKNINNPYELKSYVEVQSEGKNNYVVSNSDYNYFMFFFN